MLSANGVVGGGVSGLTKAALEALFGGAYDSNAWVLWLPDDGQSTTFKGGDLFTEERVIALVRYGNKNVSVWKSIEGQMTPMCVFVPAKWGFGKNKNIPIASAYAEGLLGVTPADGFLDHLTLPKRVVGFRDADLETFDVSECNQKYLSSLARSNDPAKMEASFEALKAKKIGGMSFIPEAVLPDSYVRGIDQPSLLDLSGLIDHFREPIPQMVYQTALTKHGLGYGAALGGIRRREKNTRGRA